MLIKDRTPLFSPDGTAAVEVYLEVRRRFAWGHYDHDDAAQDVWLAMLQGPIDPDATVGAFIEHVRKRAWYMRFQRGRRGSQSVSPDYLDGLIDRTELEDSHRSRAARLVAEAILLLPDQLAMTCLALLDCPTIEDAARRLGIADRTMRHRLARIRSEFGLDD